MTRFTLVLLRRPAEAPEFSEVELDSLQEQHLAHLKAMHDSGAMVTAGPFRNQPDESFRGMCLYRTALEETRALAEADPSVKAGRMSVDVFDWLVPEGELQA